jgi:hypothetical protein
MDFKDLREKIENLIVEIEKLIEEKSIFEASKKLEESQKFLINLKKIVENDVQGRSALRLTGELEYLSEKIDETLSKREAGKKEDGNVAFKCNWNDKHYKAPCSKKAYEFNINQGRAWCSLLECKCRQYNDEVTIRDHPCYESIALKEMYFGAGWDHTSERTQPRHIYSVRQGRMAILTTRLPGAEEKDRLIIGCLYLKTVQDDPGEETKIYGDKEKSIEIDYDKVEIKFWDYYKNAGAESLMLWASGLFRYITDETVVHILKGIGEKYKNIGKNTKEVISLIDYYEDIIRSKKIYNK